MRNILERRAKALMDGDEEAYLADLDTANKELIGYEKLVFANLRQFELAEVRYMSSQLIEGPAPGGGSKFSPVIRIIKLTADAGPGDVAPGESFFYRLEKKAGKFVVADITRHTKDTLQEMGLDAPRADAPWHTEKLRVLKVSGKAWLAADESVKDLDRYAAVADQELRNVEKWWGDRSKFPGYVLFFTRDRENFNKWHAGRDPRDNLLGVQIGLPGVRRDGNYYVDQYAGARIIVNLANSEKYGDASVAKTVRHELVHAVTSRVMATGILGDEWRSESWVVEGFARYSEAIGDSGHARAIRSHVAAGVRSGTFRGRMPDNKSFYGKDVAFNYNLGATPFLLADRLNGRDAAVELYATFLEDELSADFLASPTFNRVSERILGVSGDSFRNQWRSFIRSGG